jgi:hypothetical protein
MLITSLTKPMCEDVSCDALVFNLNVENNINMETVQTRRVVSAVLFIIL